MVAALVATAAVAIGLFFFGDVPLALAKALIGR
jgi:hypothetical protein